MHDSAKPKQSPWNEINFGWSTKHTVEVPYERT